MVEDMARGRLLTRLPTIMNILKQMAIEEAALGHSQQLIVF
jgi:hypothetical protein